VLKPALVILAAGASRRLGRCKALVDLGGRTALERLLAAGAVLDSTPPLVVTGADDAPIAAALPPGVERVFSPDWARGRNAGLALACERRPGRDLALAPIDCPLVPRAVFEALAERWVRAGAPPRGWLAPRARGAYGRARHGHPLVLGRDLARAVAFLEPDAPLRALRERASPLLSLDVPGLEVLDDLDLPADLERLRARLEGAGGA